MLAGANTDTAAAKNVAVADSATDQFRADLSGLTSAGGRFGPILYIIQDWLELAIFIMLAARIPPLTLQRFLFLTLATIVYAQVLPHGKRKAVFTENGKYRLVSTSVYAARGLRGLTKAQTVQKYRDTWQKAIDDGEAEHISLGDDVKIPDHLSRKTHRRSVIRFCHS
jgi:hypothetical protein